MKTIKRGNVNDIKKKVKALEPNHIIKVWIWIYFFLWILEGALRKWVFPASLSQPLLLIRDPIVLWVIILATRRNLLRSDFYLNGVIIVGIVSIFTAKFMGHGNLMVALYGARILLLYFPMIFVIGAVFNRDDVIKMGKVLLFIAIPMAILIGLQFYSPQSAWVNKSVNAGEEGAGFSGALGFFRPPGTFSFTNGNTLFFGLVAPFVLFFWLNPKLINRWVLIAATGALIIAVPLSISRSLMFQVVISIVFLILAVLKNPKHLGKILAGSIIVMITFLALSQTSFFQTATGAFTNRLEGANEAEGGLEGVIMDRFLGGLLKALTDSGDKSLFGFGIGSGTPLGFALLGDRSVSALSDFEWQRFAGELGMMALIIIGIRIVLSLKLAIASYRKLSVNDLLPWLLMSVGLLGISITAWHQVTSLGYFSLVGGLWIASLKRPGNKKTSVLKRNLKKKRYIYPPVALKESI